MEKFTLTELEALIFEREYGCTYTVNYIYIGKPNRNGRCWVEFECNAYALGGTGVYGCGGGYVWFDKLPMDVRMAVIKTANMAAFHVEEKDGELLSWGDKY